MRERERALCGHASNEVADEQCCSRGSVVALVGDGNSRSLTPLKKRGFGMTGFGIFAELVAKIR